VDRISGLLSMRMEPSLRIIHLSASLFLPALILRALASPDAQTMGSPQTQTNPTSTSGVSTGGSYPHSTVLVCSCSGGVWQRFATTRAQILNYGKSIRNCETSPLAHLHSRSAGSYWKM
jgi:hypothetical protein